MHTVSLTIDEHPNTTRTTLTQDSPQVAHARWRPRTHPPAPRGSPMITRRLCRTPTRQHPACHIPTLASTVTSLDHTPSLKPPGTSWGPTNKSRPPLFTLNPYSPIHPGVTQRSTQDNRQPHPAALTTANPSRRPAHTSDRHDHSTHTTTDTPQPTNTTDTPQSLELPFSRWRDKKINHQ